MVALISEDPPFPRRVPAASFRDVNSSGSSLTGVFMAVAGIAAAVAAVIGVGYVAPTALNMFTHLPGEVEAGAVTGVILGSIGGGLKALDRWGHSLSEDLAMVFMGAVAGGIVGGLFGEGWHLGTSATQQVGALIIPAVQDAISSTVAPAANGLMKPV